VCCWYNSAYDFYKCRVDAETGNSQNRATYAFIVLYDVDVHTQRTHAHTHTHNKEMIWKQSVSLLVRWGILYVLHGIVTRSQINCYEFVRFLFFILLSSMSFFTGISLYSPPINSWTYLYIYGFWGFRLFFFVWVTVCYNFDAYYTNGENWFVRVIQNIFTIIKEVYILFLGSLATLSLLLLKTPY